MSRSRKKISIFKCSTSGMKKAANKKVRLFLKNVESLTKGKYYKKVFDSWNIHDWIYKPTDPEWKEKGYRK